MPKAIAFEYEKISLDLLHEEISLTQNKKICRVGSFSHGDFMFRLTIELTTNRTQFGVASSFRFMQEVYFTQMISPKCARPYEPCPKNFAILATASSKIGGS